MYYIIPSITNELADSPGCYLAIIMIIGLVLSPNVKIGH